MTALLPPFPKFYATDASGAPLAGGLLYTYAAGTTTPLATYTDSTGTVPNTNPVVLNSSGQANVWLTSGTAYKFVLEDQFGVIQWTVDNITGGLQGAAGAPGSVWYNGSGAPSNAIGVSGDYYLDSSINTTGSGNVYTKSIGSWVLVGNILGPAGSNINRVVNGRFYQGLQAWLANGSVSPIWITPGSTPNSGSAQQFADQSISVGVTSDGSISQAFSVQALAGTQTLTFNTACYLASVAAKNANTGFVKVYLFDGQNATETLIGTYNLTASSSTPAWVAQSIDVTANLPALGDYGLRFEIQAFTDNIGGTAGTKGTYTAVDDIKLVTSSAGQTGPQGPAGPAGPVGPGGASVVQVAYTTPGTFTWTVPAGVSVVDVTCTGAGGSGGGGAIGGARGGGGGGAGATVRMRIPVTPGGTLNVVVPGAAAGVAAGTNGNSGSPCYVGSVSQPLCWAGGGGGGIAGTTVNGAGGAGGYFGETAMVAGVLQVSPRQIPPSGGGSALSFDFMDPWGSLVCGADGGAGSAFDANGATGNPNCAYAGGIGGASDGVHGGGGGGGASARGQGAPGKPTAGVVIGFGGGGGGGSSASGSNGASGASIGGAVLIEYVG